MYTKRLILLGTLSPLFAFLSIATASEIRTFPGHHTGSSTLEQVEGTYTVIANQALTRNLLFDVDQHRWHEITDSTVTPTILDAI